MPLSVEQNIAQIASLASLADSLMGFAGRLKRRAAMADDFGRLSDRARQIAAQSFDVRTSRWGFMENASRLADALQALAEETHAAARMAQETLGLDAGVAETLTGHAARLCSLIGSCPAASREAAMRAELLPLQAVMVGMQGRAGTEQSLSEEAAALARRAVSLARLSMGLRAGGREAERTASDVHQALLAFVKEAGTIAGRVTQSSDALQEDVDTITTTAHRAVVRRTGVVRRDQPMVWVKRAG